MDGRRRVGKRENWASEAPTAGAPLSEAPAPKALASRPRVGIGGRVMHRLLLIRHGEPEAAWGESRDPGLSARGREQAERTARALHADMKLVSSPMRRCRETAAPAALAFGLETLIEPRVSEVATPPGIADRRAWLAEMFPWRDETGRQEWGALSPALHAWRAQVCAAVAGIERDTAVFSHFIAINVVVGAALGRNETIVCRPAHASITELRVGHGRLRLVALGAEMRDEGVL